MCAAPGYRLVTNGLYEDFEGSFPPSGWTVVDNEGSGVVWDSCSNWGDGNYTGSSGDCADLNSDTAGSGIEFDSELWSPVIDVATIPTTTLRYLANYQNLSGSDFLDLDVSTDGGSTWTTVLSWNEDHGGFFSPPGEQVVLDRAARDHRPEPLAPERLETALGVLDPLDGQHPDKGIENAAHEVAVGRLVVPSGTSALP